jgi:hypothetical protein
MMLLIRPYGRPAPEGSHDVGRAGQVLHQSPYLAAWRAQVKLACFESYRAWGIDPKRLPLFPAGVPVRFREIVIIVHPDSCRAVGTDEPLGPPDLDKLIRSTIDGLADGRLFANDSQVVGLGDDPRKIRADGEAMPPGAHIAIDVPA